MLRIGLFESEPIVCLSSFTRNPMSMKTDWLRQNEKLLFEEGASYFHKYVAVGGNLFLTDQRLIFISSAANQHQHLIDINLHLIRGVEYFKTLFMNPNGMAILLSDGQMENFVVDDKKAWKSRVEKMISHAV